MSVEQWAIVVGVAMSVALALGPWMFMVHAKLAVIASQTSGLVTKVEKLAESHEQRLSMCLEHHARLETHQSQLDRIDDRLREMQ